MKLLLSNARVLDADSPYNGQVVDILIEAGQITRIGSGLKAEKTHDLAGKLVTPGFCDLSAHFNEPGHENKEDLASGVRSAAFSGFTDVCVLPNTDPVIETKSDVTFIRSKSAKGVQLHVIAAVSEGCKGENLTEMLDLNAAGAIAFSDGLKPIWNTELLLKALQYMHQFDGLVINRPKDIYLSQFTHMHEGVVSTMMGMNGEPALAEEIAIKRDLDVLRYTGGRIHFAQISSAKSVDLIKAAKKDGLPVTCDVAIHQLIYTDEALSDFDSHLKVDPPFRTEKDRKALIKGLKEGIIDAIVSAHQPQDPENKDLEFDLAAPGIASLPTVFSQLITLQDELPLEIAISRLTTNPRSILGLDAVSVSEGMPARLAIFDPEKEWTLNGSSNPSKSHNSPELGKKLTGKCYALVADGQFLLN